MAKKDIVDEKIKKNQKNRDDLINKQLNKLNKKLNTDSLNFDNYVKGTSLTEQYHDLINQKDKINAKQKRSINQTYNMIDVEMYKLNKKIDSRIRKLEYDLNNKKEKIIERTKYY